MSSLNGKERGKEYLKETFRQDSCRDDAGGLGVVGVLRTNGKGRGLGIR